MDLNLEKKKVVKKTPANWQEVFGISGQEWDKFTDTLNEIITDYEGRDIALIKKIALICNTPEQLAFACFRAGAAVSSRLGNNQNFQKLMEVLFA